jgi:glycosyltransferase involved in cell wall biosynthesis
MEVWLIRSSTGQGNETLQATNVPPVTVVISTRSRGDSIVATVRTILLNDYPNFALRVVDQSVDDVTAASLRPFLDNPRLRYTRSATTGVSTGRNIGIGEAQSELIAITDDDCEVAPDWLWKLVAGFARDSRIGIIFGNVVPGRHDSTSGFIPGYSRHEPFLARGMHEKAQVEGLSACMGLRRSLWQVLGGFDQMLGAGSPLKSGAESDLTIRALLARYYVYETPDMTVIHHGFRRWEEGRILIHRYWYGTGAMLVKQLKCGHWPIVQLLLRLAWRWAFGRSRIASSLGNRPQRILRLVSFIQGFVAGAMTPVDRTTRHYKPRKHSGEGGLRGILSWSRGANR